jgi:Spy/CpxP family protein refolding chaperone
MKKLLLTLSLALAGAAPLAYVQAAGPAAPAPAAAGRKFDADGPLRQALRGVLRRGLAFRDETPLSAEQRTQVREILKVHRPEIEARIKAARSAREAMHKAATQDSASETELRTAADQIADNARAGALLRAKLAREIRPILTPEQRARLDAIFQEVDSAVGKVALDL